MNVNGWRIDRMERPEPTAGDIEEWLDGEDSRLWDLFGLWTTGKRSSRWLAKQLLDEGHLARLVSDTGHPQVPPDGVGP